MAAPSGAAVLAASAARRSASTADGADGAGAAGERDTTGPACPPGAGATAPLLVGIGGQWLDVSRFADVHPGGATILRHLAGQDATSVFRALHAPHVEARLHALPRRGSYAWAASPFDALESELRKDGWYSASYAWYAGRAALVLALVAAALLCARCCAATLVGRVCTGLLLFLCWQQAGFLLHDLKHSQLTHDRTVDGALGTFFGSLCFGMSSEHWRREHFLHHVYTNAFVAPARNSNVFLALDDQMYQQIWAQHEALLPFLPARVRRCLVPVQHLLWIPVCALVGRVNLMVSSLAGEREPTQWLAFGGHVLWNVWFLKYVAAHCPNGWFDALGVYYVGAMAQGILHLQLLVNHYAQPWHERSEAWALAAKHGWHVRQLLVTVNVASPPWLDWFFGGLNLHIEHHCFPRMPRHRLRALQVRLQQLCVTHGLSPLYQQRSFADLVALTLRRFRDVAVASAERAPCSTPETGVN